MVLECRGCDGPVDGLTAFCPDCLALPEDLPGVKDWRPKVVRAICLKDRLRTVAIQRIASGYKSTHHKHP